jgi:hypothetical protein
MTPQKPFQQGHGPHGNRLKQLLPWSFQYLVKFEMTCEMVIDLSWWLTDKKTVGKKPWKNDPADRVSAGSLPFF